MYTIEKMSQTNVPLGLAAIATEPKREGSVAVAVSRCAKELDELEQALQHLCGRLDPIVRPQPPSTLDKKPEEASPCTLASTIEQYNQKITALRRAVDDILTRLEL